MSLVEILLAVFVTACMIMASFSVLVGSAVPAIYRGRRGEEGWPAKVLSHCAYLVQSRRVAWLMLAYVVAFWSMTLWVGRP